MKEKKKEEKRRNFIFKEKVTSAAQATGRVRSFPFFLGGAASAVCC